MKNIRKVLKYIKKQCRHIEKQIRSIHLNPIQKMIVSVAICVVVVGVTTLLITGTNKNGEKNQTNGKPVVDITGKGEQEEEQEDKNVISKEDQEAAKVPPIEEGDPYAEIH